MVRFFLLVAWRHGVFVSAGFRRKLSNCCSTGCCAARPCAPFVPLMLCGRECESGTPPNARVVPLDTVESLYRLKCRRGATIVVVRSRWQSRAGGQTAKAQLGLADVRVVGPPHTSYHIILHSSIVSITAGGVGAVWQHVKLLDSDGVGARTPFVAFNSSTAAKCCKHTRWEVRPTKYGLTYGERRGRVCSGKRLCGCLFEWYRPRQLLGCGQ